MVSEAELTEISRTVDGLETETIGFLRDLVRTPSVNPPGDYAAIRELLEAMYGDFGWGVETVYAPDAMVGRLGLDYPRPNVCARVSDGPGPSIALIAHHDTVPVDESEWKHDPFGAEIEDGRLYGRGAKDCKGRIAAYTFAARALEEAGLLPETATVTVVATADEETGSEAGAAYLAESGVLLPDYAVLEGDIDAVWNAGCGVLNFEVSVLGKSAHAGMNPEDGANAILGANRVLSAIAVYGDAMTERTSDVPGVDGPSCVPTLIGGGTKSNVVPSNCTITVDVRIPPDYDIEDVDEEFRSAVRDVDLPPGTGLHVERTHTIEPYSFDAASPHIRALKSNADRVRGTDVPVVGIKGSTDARHFARRGVKCANFGPGDGASNIHAADENVAIEQVKDAAVILAASICDIVDGSS